KFTDVEAVDISGFGVAEGAMANDGAGLRGIGIEGVATSDLELEKRIFDEICAELAEAFVIMRDVATAHIERDVIGLAKSVDDGGASDFVIVKITVFESRLR